VVVAFFPECQQAFMKMVTFMEYLGCGLGVGVLLGKLHWAGGSWSRTRQWVRQNMVAARPRREWRSRRVSSDSQKETRHLDLPLGWVNSPFSTPALMALLNCASNAAGDATVTLLFAWTYFLMDWRLQRRASACYPRPKQDQNKTRHGRSPTRDRDYIAR
jgi:hypothetical protein